MRGDTRSTSDIYSGRNLVFFACAIFWKAFMRNDGMKIENYATHIIISAELSFMEIGVRDLHKIKARGNSNNSNREFRIIYPYGNRPKLCVERAVKIIGEEKKKSKMHQKNFH